MNLLNPETLIIHMNVKKYGKSTCMFVFHTQQGLI